MLPNTPRNKPRLGLFQAVLVVLLGCAPSVPASHVSPLSARMDSHASTNNVQSEVALDVVHETKPGRAYRLPTAAERKLLDQLIAETERIRELHFKSPVEVRIQDRSAMRAYVSQAIDQEDLARIRRRYVALGLLDPAIDVRDLLESLMEEELVGYYDPRERVLAVRDDVARSLGERPRASDLEWRATVVHELVHALQDQHLGLGDAMAQVRTTDADNAFGALVEGDATLAMLGYAASTQGVSIQDWVRDRGQVEASLGASPDHVSGALRAAPAIVREPLLFRYRAGTLFLAELLRTGGWQSINRAHSQPPKDTLAVMVPAQYQSAQVPYEAHLPPLDWLAGRGYKVVDEDVLGSLEVGVALNGGPGQTFQLTRAWRGDRFAVLEHAGGDAAVWRVRFAHLDASGDAERLLQRLPNFGATPRKILRVGRSLLVVRGLGNAETAALFERFRAWVRTQN